TIDKCLFAIVIPTTIEIKADVQNIRPQKAFVLILFSLKLLQAIFITQNHRCCQLIMPVQIDWLFSFSVCDLCGIDILVVILVLM
ncbi:hypothetical protein RFI_34856, partial [Reticulomyxa filosa]